MNLCAVSIGHKGCPYRCERLLQKNSWLEIGQLKDLQPAFEGYLFPKAWLGWVEGSSQSEQRPYNEVGGEGRLRRRAWEPTMRTLMDKQADNKEGAACDVGGGLLVMLDVGHKSNQRPKVNGKTRKSHSRKKKNT